MKIYFFFPPPFVVMAVAAAETLFTCFPSGMENNTIGLLGPP